MTMHPEHSEHPRDPHHETAPLHDPVDAWHDHSADPKPKEAHGRTLNAKAVIAIGAGLFVTIMMTTMVVYQYYVWYTTRMLNERATPQQRMQYTDRMELQSLAKRQVAAEDPVWRDHDTVLVPFNTAVDQVVATYKGEGR